MSEASPSASPSGTAGIGKSATHHRGGDLRRFSTNPHPCYGGIDLQARSLDLGILSHEGEILLHRHMTAAPAPLLQAVTPDRAGLVGAVAWLFTWSWLADLCVHEGMPFVLGHARSRRAMHGGQAKHDQSASHTMATRLRGGMLPQAYVYAAERRATRDLLRRRLHLMRNRAERLSHGQNPHSQYHLPEISPNLAYKANRGGVAERLADAAGHKNIAVDLALITYADALRGDLARSILQTAKHHAANTLYLRHTVPGSGKILSRGLRYAIQDMARFPRVQDVVS